MCRSIDSNCTDPVRPFFVDFFFFFLPFCLFLPFRLFFVFPGNWFLFFLFVFFLNVRFWNKMERSSFSFDFSMTRAPLIGRFFFGNKMEPIRAKNKTKTKTKHGDLFPMETVRASSFTDTFFFVIVGFSSMEPEPELIRCVKTKKKTRK